MDPRKKTNTKYEKKKIEEREVVANDMQEEAEGEDNGQTSGDR